MELIVSILLIVGAVVVYALFQAIRTRKDFEDPEFQLKIDVLVGQYVAEHGHEPPDHEMPRIYKTARKELRKRRR